MRGEDRNNPYCPQYSQCLLSIDPGGAHAFEGSAERAFQGGLLTVRFGGSPSPLAMVGLGQVGEVKINRKCLSDAVSFVDGQPRDDLARLFKQRILKIGCGALSGRLFPVLNKDPA